MTHDVTKIINILKQQQKLNAHFQARERYLLKPDYIEEENTSNAILKFIGHFI